MTETSTPSSFQRLMLVLFSCVAGSMVLDFCWPGTPVQEGVATIQVKSRKAYIAGGNYHTTYTLQTRDRNVAVSKAYAATLKKGQSLFLWLSPLFQEVNALQTTADGPKERHPARLLTGLVLPALALLVFLFRFKHPHKLDTLVFVVQVLVFVNFAYLLS